MAAAVPPPPTRKILKISSTDDLRPPLPRFERYLAMFSAFLVASALFVCGLAPALLVATTITACVLGETSVVVDELLLLRNPRAEVHELRPRGTPPAPRGGPRAS